MAFDPKDFLKNLFANLSQLTDKVEVPIDDSVDGDEIYAIEQEMRSKLNSFGFSNLSRHPHILNIRALPSKLRRSLQEKYVDASQMYERISEMGVSKYFGVTPDSNALDFGRPFFNYNVDLEAAYRAGGDIGISSEDIFYRITNFQLDTTLLDATGIKAEQLWRPSQIYSEAFLNMLADQANAIYAAKESGGSIYGKGNIAYFDVETGGLDPEEGLRKIDVRIVDEKGNLVDKLEKSIAIDNGFGEWGIVGKGEKKTVSQFWDEGAEGGVVGYKQGVKELLDFMEKHSDFRMMGANLQFDIQALLKYGDLVEGEDLAQFQRFIAATTDSGKFFDTRFLSMLFLDKANFKMHPFLEAADMGPKLYSISNFLASTNLLDLMVQDRHAYLVGKGITDLTDSEHVDRLAKMLAEGLHEDVDTVFGAGIGKYLLDPRLEYGEGKGLQDERLLRAITASKVSTPRARNLTMDEIDENIARLLSKDEKISPFEYLMLYTRREGYSAPSEDINDIIKGSQQLRKFLSQVTTTDGSRRAAGVPSWFAGKGFLKNFGKSSFESYAEISEELGNLGAPWAGLGLQERVLTSAFGMNQVGAGAQSAQGLLGQYFGVSYWTPSDRRVFTIGLTDRTLGKEVPIQNKMISAPVELIEEALGQDIKSLSLGSYFTYGADEEPIREITQMYRLGDILEDADAEQAKIAEFIESKINGKDISQLKQYGFASSKEVEDFLQILRSDRTKNFGIQVSRFRGGKGGAAAEAVYQALARMQGSRAHYRGEELLDFDILRMRGLDEKGKMASGAVFSRLGRDKENLKNLYGHAEKVAEIFDTAREEARNSPYLFNNINSAGARAAGGRIPWDQRIPEMYKAVKESRITPWALGATAAAGVAYLFYKKHKKNEPFEDTIEAQPTEVPTARAYDPNEIDMMTRPIGMGPMVRPNTGSRTGLDPMQTAGVMRQLDENSVRHSKMGPSKYNYLYGGSY